MSVMRALALGAAFAGVGWLASPAWADDTAAADALFASAKELADAGDFEKACPKFEASLEASRTLGTLLNLADCLEKQGRLASAFARWEEAIKLATEKNDERVKFAGERKTALEPRVPSVVLEVKQGAEPLKVSLGKKEVEALSYGLPIKVDPGKVQVVVARDDLVLETVELELSEGEAKRHALDLDKIAKAHPSTKAKEMVPADPAQRYAGIVILSVGVAGLATFGILESVALARRAEADDGRCVEQASGDVVCSPEGYELASSAGDLAEAGQWVGVAGLATAALGLTLFLTAPQDQVKEPEKVTVVVPWFAPGAGGVVVGGRF